MQFRVTFLISLIFVILFSSASIANPLVSQISTRTADSLIPIISSRFYVGTRDSANDEFTWNESNFVPLIPGNTCYSWVVKLDTDRESVQLKEVLILPSKPKTWGDVEGMLLQHNNRVSVIQKEIKVENGTILNSWCVSEGDPTGNYKIDVIVNGVLAKSFSFIVGLKL